MEKYSKIICFSKGTLVHTKQGQKKIEMIKPGEEILTYNHNKNKVHTTIVSRIATSRHSYISLVTFANGIKILTTNDHPFWEINKGWSTIIRPEVGVKYNLEIEKLLTGDKCLLFNGELCTEIEIIQIERIQGDYIMYTVSAGENHCYFANGILVHDVNVTDLDLNQEHVTYEDLIEIE